MAGAIALGNNCITEGRFLTITGAITLENCTLSTSIIATSDQVIRSDTQPQDLTLIGNMDGVVKWQKSTDIIFSNATDITNTTALLSSAEMGILTATTYFRAVVTIGGKTINSTIVTIAINKTTIPGVISSNQEFCSASQPADLILSGNYGLVVKWQSALNSDFTTPTDIINTTNTLTGTAIGIVSVTTFYRAVVQNCTCCPFEYSSPAKISIAIITSWNGTSWNNGLPSSSKAVVFTENYNANENIAACSVTINNGAAVIVNSGFTMTITNELIISGGFLTFENNASLVQINETALNSGSITYNRQSASVRDSDYSYWSSPVAGETLDAAFPNSPSDKIYSYDAFSTPEDWKQEAPSTIMSIGTGYIVQAPQTNSNTPPNTYEASFIGKPNNGVFEIPIASADTSNLLGNPYPSAIDADTFLIENSNILDGTIYFWTHSAAIQSATNITNGFAGSGSLAYTSDDYASYNLSGGVAANSAGKIPSGKIPTGQAFFTTSKASNAKALFNNDMRLTGGSSGVNNSQFYKLSTKKTKTVNVIEKK